MFRFICASNDNDVVILSGVVSGEAWRAGAPPPPPSDNFLGALKFVIVNVKYHTKICKVQLVNKFKDSSNLGISIAIQLSNSFWE